MLSFAVLAFYWLYGVDPTHAQSNQFLSPAQDRAFLEATIANERPDFRPPEGITGLTVPHHLLAADLIARGFWAVSRGNYDRIILISPDHFRVLPHGFAVVDTPLPTAFGPTRPAKHAAQDLTRQEGLFAVHSDPMREHGIMAVLPFIVYFFPDAEILPVVASIANDPASWKAAANALALHFTERTLIVQSTDYSHFLTVGAAAQRDQQVIGVISSREPDRVIELHQPAHLDSKAAQYIQMDLQQRRGAQVAVVTNRNSVSYGTSPENTTSYIVSAYHPDPAKLSRLDYSDHERLFFGGDVLIGRFMLPVLTNTDALAAILNAVYSYTAGDPLVVNLEGVITSEYIPNAPAGSHLMPRGLALPILDDMGVVAAGLANNHALDFGESAFETTRNILQSAGLQVLSHGAVADLGPVRVLALNFLPGRDPHVLNISDMGNLCSLDARAPLIAFVHWGVEYTSKPSVAEQLLADRFAACGFSALIGGHSHRADTTLRLSLGQMQWAFSLGNLLFDQNASRASGQLAELRVFEQGTVALRLITLPNLFELGRSVANRGQTSDQ